uniref:Uncharacterized protein n=1 Tax=Chromera velia CCMP2878 TaxID=1169474 RepID=A0A0G4H0E4_9ALVE|eukprot:Cvel_24119.t1-p1 / transcript=Cvel_24119.t1 / gene=Cvel_24119 / organism=Chromera_velia_CCMP2878 / gene_product=hypothetical protein / transcript_product=hypothetical protein / location=Cvel_scaffold2569:22176-24896(+) / protein_length=907 / sequence_SO=supercontig / SO=protein_coding / is_pseudo=false
MDSSAPLPFPLLKLFGEDGKKTGGRFLSLALMRTLSSGPSVVLQLVCKAMRKASIQTHVGDGQADRAPPETKVEEEIVRGGRNSNLCRWLFSLPVPPQPEKVLRACAAANDEDPINALSGNEPLCVTGAIRSEGKVWGDEEIRSVSNLLAVCDGAIEGGHPALLRATLERLVPPLSSRIRPKEVTLEWEPRDRSAPPEPVQPRVDPRTGQRIIRPVRRYLNAALGDREGSGCLSDVLWEGWLRQAMRNGQWGVRKTLLEIIDEMQSEKEEDGGVLRGLARGEILESWDGGKALLPLEVLQFLSSSAQSPSVPLEDVLAPFSVSVAYEDESADFDPQEFISTDSHLILWVKALGGDIEGILSSPLPLSESEQILVAGWEAAPVFLHIPQPLFQLAVLVCEMMRVAALSGHSDTVPQIFEWSVKGCWLLSAEVQDSFDRWMRRHMLPLVFNAAVQAGDTSLLDWVCAEGTQILFPEGFEWGDRDYFGLKDAFFECKEKMGVVKWIEEKNAEFFKRVFLSIDGRFEWIRDLAQQREETNEEEVLDSEEELEGEEEEEGVWEKYTYCDSFCIEAAVADGDLQLVQYLDERFFFHLNRKVCNSPEGKGLCYLALERRQWDVLRWLRTRGGVTDTDCFIWNGGTRWWSKFDIFGPTALGDLWCPHAHVPESPDARMFQIEFAKALYDSQSQQGSPPEIPSGLGDAIGVHIRRVVAVPPFPWRGEERYSSFHPFQWTFLNFSVARWLFEKGGEGVQRKFAEWYTYTYRLKSKLVRLVVAIFTAGAGQREPSSSVLFLEKEKGLLELRKVGADGMFRRIHSQLESLAAFCEWAEAQGVDIVEGFRNALQEVGILQSSRQQPAAEPVSNSSSSSQSESLNGIEGTDKVANEWSKEEILAKWGKGSMRDWMMRILDR